MAEWHGVRVLGEKGKDGTGWAPAAIFRRVQDAGEEKDGAFGWVGRIALTAEVAGVRADDLNPMVQNDLVTLKGQRT